MAGCRGFEQPDLFSDEVKRAALAHSRDGLVSDHPPTYVGDVRAAATAFGGFELFVLQTPRSRLAWIVRLATAVDEAVEAPRERRWR